MNLWRSAAAGMLSLLLAGALVWAQESPEASRPVRGTGEAGRPSSGALTIQGIFQGRPVTVDFHHQAAALAVTAHSVGISHITSMTHITGTVRLSGVSGAVVGVTASALSVIGNIAHVSAVSHMVISGGQSTRFTMFRVNCGTTAATAISIVTNRRDLRVKNAGTVNIYVGGDHVTVTTTNAWTLHAGSGATSLLELPNFQGRLDCIADGPSQTLEIIQLPR